MLHGMFSIRERLAIDKPVDHYLGPRHDYP
jgi:hypothetical protein